MGLLFTIIAALFIFYIAGPIILLIIGGLLHAVAAIVSGIFSIFGSVVDTSEQKYKNLID